MLHGIPFICLHSSIIDSKDWQNGADDRRQSYQRWTFNSYNYYIRYDSKVFCEMLSCVQGPIEAVYKWRTNYFNGAVCAKKNKII